MKARSLFRGFSRSFYNRNSTTAGAVKNNFYEILGVDQNATDTQIKHAYFKLAKTHHPDVKTDSHDSALNFELINEAYQTLKDPKSRKLYDRTGLSADEQTQEGVGGFGVDVEEELK